MNHTDEIAMLHNVINIMSQENLDMKQLCRETQATCHEAIEKAQADTKSHIQKYITDLAHAAYQTDQVRSEREKYLRRLCVQHDEICELKEYKTKYEKFKEELTSLENEVSIY